MLLSAYRIVSDRDASLSTVHIDKTFECFGLEDEYREAKLPGETRIPAGQYAVGLRTTGGFHNRYLNKFDWHQGMLQVLNVPGFEYILIHIGNTDEDTAGCLLVGAGCNTNGEITVSSSRVAYEKLYKKVIQAAIDGVLFIEFVDLDQ